MKVGDLRKIIVVLAGVFGFLSFLMMLGCVVMAIGKIKTNVSETSMFKYYKLDPHTGESYKGFLELSEPLQEDEFLSYQDENEKYILISNFGSNEYKCTATCVCGDEGERRSTIFLKQGLLYLVAASTSIIALEFAKNHFDEECQEKMKDECHINSVSSKVEACDFVGHEEDRDDDDDDSPDYRYFCSGYCYNIKAKYLNEIHLDDWRVVMDKATIKRVQPDFNSLDCSKIYLSDEVIFPKEDWNIQKEILRNDGIMKTNPETFAMASFIYDQLHPHCEKNSLDGKEGDEYRIPLCAGIDFSLYEQEEDEDFTNGKIELMNPSTHCIKHIEGFSGVDVKKVDLTSGKKINQKKVIEEEKKVKETIKELKQRPLWK